MKKVGGAWERGYKGTSVQHFVLVPLRLINAKFVIFIDKIVPSFPPSLPPSLPPVCLLSANLTSLKSPRCSPSIFAHWSNTGDTVKVWE